MQHIIKKQVVEIHLPEQQDMFALQHAASKYYYSHILPALEKLFEELATDQEVLQIDRLEIDLGAIQWNKQVKELSIENISGILKQQLLKQCGGRLPQRGMPVVNDNNKDFRKISLVTNTAEQWLYYMEHGVLRWNMAERLPNWPVQVLEALATSYPLVQALKKLLLQNPGAITRIVQEHDEVFLSRLVAVITAKEQQQLTEWVHEWAWVLETLPVLVKQKKTTTQPIPALPYTPKPVSLWKMLFIQLVQTETPVNTIAWVQQQCTKLLVAQQPQQKQVRSLLQHVTLLRPVVTAYQPAEAVPRKLKNKQADVEEPLPEHKKETGVTDINGKKKKTKAANNTEEEKVKPPRQQKEEAGELPGDGKPVTENAISENTPFTPETTRLPGEGLFVTHAGLVLLHPFYRFLFRNTGITKDHRFAGRAEQEKAVRLLHYIATGNTEAEEHLFAVPKILCAWPLEEPMDTGVQLTGQEIIEASDLLNAAIEQWTILKKTSADGLREGFLQRNGKTYTKNGSIYFQVEHSAIDMLLDHLPWNLSLIKLPWINEMIRVEWR